MVTIFGPATNSISSSWKILGYKSGWAKKSKLLDLGYELIQGLFAPQEAALVLSIPLSRHFAEDKIIWPFNASGSYFVKIGYNFLAKENFSHTQHLSNPSSP